MKHAYLILAHTDFSVLEALLQLIDDDRNDVYIHFDKKVKELPKLEMKNAQLIILENRVDVRWGDISVVWAELRLFESALKENNYSYLHLLSGVDLPLKPQDDIHVFFEKKNGKEFIGFSQYDYRKEVERKVNRYHLFPKHFRSNNLFLKGLRAILLRFEFLFRYKRNTKINFKKGTQWVSITPAFAKYVLSKKEGLNNIYHHTFCSDEIFLQTLCWNSEFQKNIYDLTDESNGCVRMIGWKDGQLFDWTENDFEILMQSNAMFARKFNSKNKILIDAIIKATLKRQI